MGGVHSARTSAGEPVLVVGRADGEMRARDPATGESLTLSADELQPEDRDPLAVVAAALGGPPVGSDPRAVGLLAEVVDRSAVPAARLTTEYAACESDLTGMLAELRVAGLVAETRVAGRPGYRATENGTTLVRRRRE